MEMQNYPGAVWKPTFVDAAMNPMQVTGSNSPHVRWSEREFGESPLFKSHRDVALILDKMVAPGFGHLPAGLVMAVFTTGARHGMVYPVDFSGVPLAAATSAGATKVTVAAHHAAFFVVGDKVAVGTASTNEAATIKAITPQTSGAVDLELVTALTQAYTTSQHVHPAGFTGAVLGVLEQAAYSDNDNGAYATIVLSNAVLYKHKLLNDPEATALKTAIPTVVVDGQYVILK